MKFLYDHEIKYILSVWYDEKREKQFHEGYWVVENIVEDIDTKYLNTPSYDSLLVGNHKRIGEGKSKNYLFEPKDNRSYIAVWKYMNRI